MSSDIGLGKVTLAKMDMPGLRQMEVNYSGLAPLSGVNILGCVTVTPETANFIITLKKLGATNIRWCSDNRFATDDDIVSYLISEGINVFAESNMDEKTYFENMRKAANFSPEALEDGILIVDDGCDISEFLLKENNPAIHRARLITEQTTCGVNKFRTLMKTESLGCAVVDVNGSNAKKYFDNYYGVRESFVYSLINSLPLQIAGKKIAIFGYGSVGEGVAKALSSFGAHILVSEADLFKLIKSDLEGFTAVSKEEALQQADIAVLATGCHGVINADDLLKAKSNMVLCNIGHGNEEFDQPFLEREGTRTKINQYLTKYQLEDGKSFYSMCDGALTNMISGTGNPPHVMSMTFSLHLLEILNYLDNHNSYTANKIQAVQPFVEKKVLEINFPEISNKVNVLTEFQRNYLGLNIPSIQTPTIRNLFNELVRIHKEDDLGIFPTRIIKSDYLSNLFNSNFYMKLEYEADLIGSGNKVRKLRFLLPHLREKGITDVIIDGTINSNSCMAIAHYSQRHGLKAHLILSGSNDDNSPNLRIMRDAGADIKFIGEWNSEIIEESYTALSKEIYAHGGRPYSIPTGVSSAIPTIGMIKMGEEIDKQASDLGIDFTKVILPIGTGGTIAGLDISKQINQSSWDLTGVLTANDKKFFIDVATKLAEELGLPDYEPTFNMWDGAIGEGYAQYTEQDRKQISNIYNRTGLYFDSCYTNKALNGLVQMKDAGLIQPKSNILFIHTGGINERHRSIDA